MDSEAESVSAFRDAQRTIMYNYADALDTRNWDKLASLFTPDAVFTAQHFPKFGADPIDIMDVTGNQAIAAAIATFIETLAASYHFVSNELIERSADGLTARTACYLRAYHAGTGERAHLFEESLARFIHHSARVGTDWKVTRMEEQILVMLGTPDVFGL